MPRNSASQAAYDAALLLLVRSEFVGGQSVLAAWRINQHPGHEIVVVDLKCDSKGKLGGEEIPLTFRTNPKFRKTPVGRRLDRQEIVFARDNKNSFAFCFVSADVRIEDL